ncbi:hypothetical protein [Haloferax sp. ATB1]|uniref:hypothetical protein n=1 Tax=Haloferax sp. ATB1 TaxID=1508454 RepID=UPI0005B1D1AB|nr:hypothetical protein [Haloferax sp. ATB1]
MSFVHKLQYAGSKPYQHERSLVDDELTYHEYEQLIQDETYVRLAQLRWLTYELESSLSRDDDVPQETKDELFRAVDGSDAHLSTAVDAYVDEFVSNLHVDEEANQ